MAPSVSPLNWTGNKSCIYDMISGFMPEHNVYIEPCMGSAEVFLRKKPAKKEIINDYNGDLVNFFRVLQSTPHLPELIGRLYLSFHSEEMFKRNQRLLAETPNLLDDVFDMLNIVCEITSQEVERAAAFFENQVYSFSSMGQSFAIAPKDITSKFPKLRAASNRLRDAIIMHRDYKDVIRDQACVGAFILLDPPYKGTEAMYKKSNFDANEHDNLFALMNGVHEKFGGQCKFLITYNNDPYIRALADRYTKLIGENPLWTLADIYADEGITGTSMKRRDEFKRMIADCKKGKIDRILTKSVSRFARNTVDCLETVRLLSGLGISILFEKEQIDTAKMSSEVILAFMSTQAQDESVSISGNMRWSYEKRMKSGNFICCYTPYGYRWVNHRLTVVPEEADVVRKIYSDFLSGTGMVKIAKQLNENGVPHRHGGKWTPEAVDYILHNEKYMGDALLQKFYTTVEFPVRQKENRGERTMYYVRNSHEAIIPKETFEAVKALTEARRSQFRPRKEHHPLTGYIRCAECGHPFRRVGRGPGAYWKCSRYIKQKTDCTPVRIDEEDVIAALVRACNTLRQNPAIIESVIGDLNQLYRKANGGQPAIKELDSRIATLSSQLHLISQLQAQGVLDPADFAGQQSALSHQIMRLRSERAALLRRDDAEEIADLQELADLLADSDTDFTADDLPEMLQAVQGIRVESETDVTFILLGGLQIPEQLPQKKRR